MGQSGTNSFTTYLQEMQRWEKRKEPIPVGVSTAFVLLTVLAGNSGQPMALIPDLQAAGGMSFNDFAEAIKRLEEAGYIALTGGPARESAQLTEFGADVAALVRPA